MYVYSDTVADGTATWNVVPQLLAAVCDKDKASEAGSTAGHEQVQCVSQGEPTDRIGRIGTNMRGMRCHGHVHRVARSRGGCKCTSGSQRTSHYTITA